MSGSCVGSSGERRVGVVVSGVGVAVGRMDLSSGVVEGCWVRMCSSVWGWCWSELGLGVKVWWGGGWRVCGMRMCGVVVS